MGANTRPDAPNRALSPIEPADLSVAYRRAAAADFSDGAPRPLAKRWP